MTETQRKWLTEYLGECWHKYNVDGHSIKYTLQKKKCLVCGKLYPKNKTNRTFTSAQDKQDLLEKIVNTKDGTYFLQYVLNGIFSKLYIPQTDDDGNLIEQELEKIFAMYDWFILLSPLETAELVCRWKGVK